MSDTGLTKYREEMAGYSVRIAARYRGIRYHPRFDCAARCLCRLVESVVGVDNVLPIRRNAATHLRCRPNRTGRAIHSSRGFGRASLSTYCTRNQVAIRDATSPFPIVLGGVNYLAATINIVTEMGD